MRTARPKTSKTKNRQDQKNKRTRASDDVFLHHCNLCGRRVLSCSGTGRRDFSNRNQACKNQKKTSSTGRSQGIHHDKELETREELSHLLKSRNRRQPGLGFRASTNGR